MSELVLPLLKGPLSEAAVETSGIVDFLRDQGYRVTLRKTGLPALDKAWPSKTKKAGAGQPDLFLFTDEEKGTLPICVWENKGTDTDPEVALAEAKGYVEGAHALLRGKPGLPRIAVGYNGEHLRAAYLNTDNKWVVLRDHGKPVVDTFLGPEALSRGVRSDGNLVEAPEDLDAPKLRAVLEQLKNVYRGIPALKSGRRPIDFTVALLTLRLVVERKQWGTWSEQPSLVPDALDLDHQVAERFLQLVARCMNTSDLANSYGSIFRFQEQSSTEGEVAFDFESVLKEIPTGRGHFSRMFELIDSLPVLHGADIDIFGEVYQAIGDDAVKRAFGEYFTGRHIISGLLPIFFSRAGVTSFENSFAKARIADIACGTGGFLTETLRYVKRTYALDDDAASSFAEKSFFGYDLSASSASRARVNMYFAGDGFSVVHGGVDSLDASDKSGPGDEGFDYILTNPPYGKSSAHGLLHEAFLKRVIELLKPGVGWGLVVLPTGTLENPRSRAARVNLLRQAQLTDVVSLPKHAFAPYTMQRTAIAIFRRRVAPLAETSVEDILAAVGNEKVSMFIVDHDGYANSDKRFPTNRAAADGSWLHNDLSSWIGLDGAAKPSRLFDALINERYVEPSSSATVQYARLSLSELHGRMGTWGADRGSGVELLPDRFLRDTTATISPADYAGRATALSERLADEVGSDTPVRDELARLLSSPIDLSDVETEIRALGCIMTITKGNPGLTEEAIYLAHSEKGLPVYGGGISPPLHRVSASAKTSAGRAVTVFEGPAIILSVDGSSGSMQVVDSGKFVCNHHAAVLKPKSKDTDLYFVAQQAEARLRALASNQGGSATLTLGTIRTLEIEFPVEADVISVVSKARRRLTRIRRLLS